MRSATLTTPARPWRTLAWLLFIALPVLQVPYPFLSADYEGAATVVILLLITAFSLAHLAATEGVRAALLLLVLSVVICGGAEILSVATGWPFGRYTYDATLGPPVAGVPLLVPLAWLMVAYPAYRVAQLLAPRAPVVVAALALTAWDLFLDPRMVALGVWNWLEPPFYAGVPARNYFGWLVTSLLLAAAFARLARPALPQRGDLFALLPVLLYGWLWLGFLFLNLVWWREPTVALVAGIGMGVFALPALVLAWRWGRAQ